jgi:hypothetical protein
MRPVVRLLSRESGVGKALVMPQVQIRLRPVVRHKYLAMLKRRHGPGIHIQVGIELHQVHAKAAALKQTPDGSGRQAFS